MFDCTIEEAIAILPTFYWMPCVWNDVEELDTPLLNQHLIPCDDGFIEFNTNEQRYELGEVVTWDEAEAAIVCFDPSVFPKPWVLGDVIYELSPI